MTHKKTSHEFALFVQDLFVKNKEVIVQDQESVHRLTHVLRLVAGDTITLFNDTQAVHATVISMTKKIVVCELNQILGKTGIEPRIIMFLPVLKKEALEEAIYACVELGVTELVLIKTEKTHTAAFIQAHRDRLYKIIRAAQEQAKQFTPIVLSGPYELSDALIRYDHISDKVVALQGGGRLIDCLVKNSKHMVVAVGPEADFTDTEKIDLQKHGFKTCSLGPTVLRAQQAVTVLVGAIRTLTV